MNVPEGWQLCRFEDLASVQAGLVSPLDDRFSALPHIGPENIQSGGGLKLPLSTASELGLTSGKHRCKPGAIVYSKVRPNLNKVCAIDFEALCSADAYPVYVRQDRVDSGFLLQSMRAPRFLQQAIATSTRSGMPKINRDELNGIEILAPPVPEQRKIADILTTWDEALEKLDALITAKDRQKQALMQQLLTGKKRVMGATGRWKKVRMGEVLERVFRPIEWHADLPLNLVSLRRRCGGLFRRPGVKGSEYKTQDLHKIRAGDFLISKRQVVHGAWGYVAPEFEGGHVSKEYAILDNRSPEKLHMPFFAWLAQTRRLMRLARVSSTGVHIEKLIFDPGVFLRESIRIPCDLAEQQRVATILDTCEAERNLLRRQRDALDLQKRGLMQRLLTGKIRVSSTSEANV